MACLSQDWVDASFYRHASPRPPLERDSRDRYESVRQTSRHRRQSRSRSRSVTRSRRRSRSREPDLLRSSADEHWDTTNHHYRRQSQHRRDCDLLDVKLTMSSARERTPSAAKKSNRRRRSRERHEPRADAMPQQRHDFRRHESAHEMTSYRPHSVPRQHSWSRADDNDDRFTDTGE